MSERREARNRAGAAEAIDGDARAAALMGAVYDELRALAAGYLRRERAGHTLQPTALVHEAYLRLVDQDPETWRDRTHFLAIAARSMRQILVNHAVRHRAEKRGAGWTRVSLSEAEVEMEATAAQVMSIDEALARLARIAPEKAQLVELRFFGGLTVDETAQVLKVSRPTVERGWRFARAWLRREMEKGTSP